MTALVARQRGIPVRDAAGGQVMLERGDFRRLKEAIWALINEGVMVVGMGRLERILAVREP
jgi:hypothetical protein